MIEAFSVQPVATSVTVRVWQNSPLGSPPSWPTVSSWQNPGTVSAHSAQVLNGIEDFSMLPGRVNAVPRRVVSCARSAANRRSIVAGDMANSCAATASSMSNSSCRRSAATRSGNAACSRLPVGPSNTAQQRCNASITAGP